MDDFEEWVRRNVRCCCCGRNIHGEIVIYRLDKEATWESPVWTHNLLIFEPDRALAIICQECAEAGGKPKYAVEWDGENVKYHPVEELRDLPPITPEYLRDVERRLRHVFNPEEL